ncbi:ubiquitin-like conjugating enzyme [Pilobolus umbonatus]|nr:ubiquitin-like conjugating enzyme [Pilobolus umbonatus]
MTYNILKFTPFSSAVDAALWQSLVTKKLDELKLSQSDIPIHGYYTIGQNVVDNRGRRLTMPSHFSIPADGLDIDIKKKPNYYNSKGILINTNTIEEFRTIDKNQLFQQVTEKIVTAVNTGHAVNDPNQLNQFLLITFADLKAYKFYYWFAFPAIMPQPEPWTLGNKVRLSLKEVFWINGGKELLTYCLYLFKLNCLVNAYDDLKQTSDSPYFLLKTGFSQIALLGDFGDFYEPKDECIFGFVDPSTSELPGWPLRNLLYLIHQRWNIKRVKIVCYRMGYQSDQSFLLETELPNESNYQNLKSAGWERNVQGKLGPRMADLGPLMDPTRLADTSVDLNLKLMKWRILPELDLEKIKQTKCLLLGAGTLGCYVGRCLLGWGVRTITFVDNGTVSFSNPVRQPLYHFQDALNGGQPKAEAAAKHIKLIQPTVNAKGYCLSIPMPGHPYSSDDNLVKDMECLSELIGSHDVIFLLTDSRESRWLPTLLGSKLGKIVINSALGFDTYLVMRHGPRQSQSLNKLGCYFCNDIVAPADSLKNRTLDQQCTVTRPGLAAIASALSVELMVSIIQHPEGIHAQADTATTTQPSSILGLLPHQIRGFLGQFSNMLITGQVYDKCTACSEKIINEYEQDSLVFLKKVLNDSLYLESVTGLDKLKEESEALLSDWTHSDEDDF